MTSICLWHSSFHARLRAHKPALFLSSSKEQTRVFLSRCVTYLSTNLFRLIDDFTTFQSCIPPSGKVRRNANNRPRSFNHARSPPIRSFEQPFTVVSRRPFFPHSFALVSGTSRGSVSSFEHTSVRVTSLSSVTRTDSPDSRIPAGPWSDEQSKEKRSGQQCLISHEINVNESSTLPPSSFQTTY